MLRVHTSAYLREYAQARAHEKFAHQLRILITSTPTSNPRALLCTQCERVSTHLHRSQPGHVPAQCAWNPAALMSRPLSQHRLSGCTAAQIPQLPPAPRAPHAHCALAAAGPAAAVSSPMPLYCCLSCRYWCWSCVCQRGGWRTQLLQCCWV